MMKPSLYMLYGSFTGIAFVLGAVALPETIGTTSMCIFAAGALFGKGYGVWEERSRKRT